MLRGQLLSSNITLNTSCELLHSLLHYLWPPLTFGPSADHWNSVLRNLRTSICKGEAHMLKPTSLNPPPSCLVPRLAYAPPLLPLSSEFVGGTDSDTMTICLDWLTVTEVTGISQFRWISYISQSDHFRQPARGGVWNQSGRFPGVQTCQLIRLLAVQEIIHIRPAVSQTPS